MTQPFPASSTGPATRFPAAPAVKFFLLSGIGIVMFFVPVTFAGKSSIPLDHLVTAVTASLPGFVPWYALGVILLGALYPFVTGQWKKNRVERIFSFLKLLGLAAAVMLIFEAGPAWLFAPDIGPFLFEKLVIPVGLLVPIGSAFLALLVGYGLLEFTGVLVRPFMRAVWKTPGKSAIDAVASFVGSYSIALLITNRLFKEGKYTVREAAIIATGFSTVSATFMVIVAKTLALMDHWNLYFWSTFFITFAVTAITARIPPLSRKPDTYATGAGDPESEQGGNRWKQAWREGMEAAARAPSLLANVGSNLADGFRMTMSILPSILSVGLIGLLLAKYTPVFDVFGWLFYPVTWALQIPEPMLAAKAAAIEIAEMFLPALLAVKAPLVTKFVVAVVSVSSILFFSASIPCILSTEIPFSIRDLFVIWLERTLLTLVIAAPVAHWLF